MVYDWHFPNELMQMGDQSCIGDMEMTVEARN